MSTIRGVRIFVAPEFKTMIKIESAKKEMTLIDYTRSLARKSLIQEEQESPLNGNNDKRRPSFGWKV